MLEVGDIEEALAFCGEIFDFTLRGKGATSVFIDMGDQFLQLTENRDRQPDRKRHFGFVVDDTGPVRAALARLGVGLIGARLDFRDPWGNRVEVVPYAGIQFTKAGHVLAGMGAPGLTKTPGALAELAKKGMAPG